MRHYGLAGLRSALAEDTGACARKFIEKEIIDKIYEALQVCHKSTKDHIAKICGLSREELAGRVYSFLEQVSAGNKTQIDDRIEGKIFECLAEMEVVSSVTQKYSCAEGRIALLMPWLAAAFSGCEWY
ncbi:MAG: hypothetical protein LUE27_01765 [Clostridia bacterium]|nr:hypothetical protein [Clostridia bacterium]